jgi:hypothetical protein
MLAFPGKRTATADKLRCRSDKVKYDQHNCSKIVIYRDWTESTVPEITM